MADIPRLVIDAVLGLAVLILLVWLMWRSRKMGPELVIARMSILQTNTYWAIIFVSVAMVFLLVSTGVEIWEQLTQQSWIINNEWLETVSLSSLLLGLTTFAPVVRVPRQKTA